MAWSASGWLKRCSRAFREPSVSKPHRTEAVMETSRAASPRAEGVGQKTITELLFLLLTLVWSLFWDRRILTFQVKLIFWFCPAFLARRSCFPFYHLFLFLPLWPLRSGPSITVRFCPVSLIPISSHSSAWQAWQAVPSLIGPSLTGAMGKNKPSIQELKLKSQAAHKQHSNIHALSTVPHSEHSA